MKTEQRWRRDAFSGLRITCRAMPAPGNTLISASCSEDSWGWTWLAWVTSSSVSQLLAIPLGSRNVWRLTSVPDFHQPLFSLRSSCFLGFLSVLASLEAYVFGMQHTACPWHFFNTSGPSSVGHLGPKFSTKTWNQDEETETTAEPRDRWVPSRMKEVPAWHAC